jgi:transposase
MGLKERDMRVEEHYAELMQLAAPWEVVEVNNDLAKQRVTVRVSWPMGVKVSCPECGKEAPIYDRMPERTWRHLSVMQYRLEVSCAVPRCHCPEHGVKGVRVPWAEPGSRFTLHFEAFAVAVIAACRSFSQAAQLLGLHWESVQRIIDSAVARGLARRSTEGLRRVGLDEKSFLRGQSYVSLMTDLDGQRVLEVMSGRDTAVCVQLWEALPERQRAQVEAAAMDMGAPFILGTQQAAPHVDIVHDRFHISKLLNDAVDQTRREESVQLAEENDDRLKNTRYRWLEGQTPEEKKEQFTQLLATNLRTGKAWAYKEQMIDFWTQPDLEAGQSFFKNWYRRAVHSQLPKIKKVAQTLKTHLAGMLTYFQHRITNALTEGFNSKIQAIKADARGFRRFENYRTRILFFCGKLDLLPTLPSPSIHTIP